MPAACRDARLAKAEPLLRGASAIRRLDERLVDRQRMPNERDVAVAADDSEEDHPRLTTRARAQ
jgi:hypothetical protein